MNSNDLDISWNEKERQTEGHVEEIGGERNEFGYKGWKAEQLAKSRPDLKAFGRALCDT